MSGNRRIAVFLWLAILLLSACGEPEQSQNLLEETLTAPEQANYKTVPVQEGEYVTSISGTASVRYLKSASLSWEKSNACWREILVEPGQQVKAGEVLAVFDIIASKADWEEVKLQQERARDKDEKGREARLSAIAQAEKSAEGLTGHALQIARLRIEKLETDYEQFVYESECQLAQLEERRKALEAERENHTLKAPFDGVIDTVAACTPGERVAAGAVLITMHEPDRFLLFTEENAEELRYNMQVSIQGADNGRNVSGRVVSAPNIFPAGMSAGQVLIALDGNAAADALGSAPGYVCRTEDLKNVLVTDRSAVKKENGKSFVYVLEAGGIQKRFVQPGFGNASQIWLLDGVLQGQSLIVD